ncbi:MAG: TPMT family class I SAM-dependent methyltransferase [Verrucomicrobia bacterium]|jgi:hypothetical protein|nr:TPMT family class I SAM-dependent methyltransferase [Verrucomicrobiota bacterium]
MSEAHWESLYQAGDMRWEKGAPSPGLVDFLAAHRALPGETVCVPGCGTGHDVCEWAKSGFRAYGYDIAPGAIRLTMNRSPGAPVCDRLSLGSCSKPVTDRRSTTGWFSQFRRADFLRDEPPFLFDWVFEHTLFCAIQPDERDLYTRAVLRWLKPGGHYLAINYLIPDTDGPPFGTTRDELCARFSPHFDLRQEWVPRLYPNRTGLELMLWWRRKIR